VNIEQLKQRLAANVTVVDGWRLCKLNAVDGMAYSKLFADTPDDAPFEQVAVAYAFLISKCTVDESGQKHLDSDEGRALLRQLDRETFCKLGKAALDWNLGDAKKN
jgi:hypothetical protein